MTTKHDETENAFPIDDGDSQQLSLILKYFVSITEKEINHLNNFLKVAKFNQKKWLKPVVDVYHATFNYSEIICGKNFNFMSKIEIRR